MRKALDMMTAAMGQAKHELACIANTNSQLRSNIEALKAENDNLRDDYKELAGLYDRACSIAKESERRAVAAEGELYLLRSQVAALLPKPTFVLGDPAVGEVSIYGGGAGDLDVSKDNGMVLHGEFAE